MPGGIPVACVAIGRAGAKNAAYLAAQMLALSDPAMTARLHDDRRENAQAVLAKDQALKEKLRHPTRH
jgi:5-(carboxyamino)imidazole ribonucleotide mutase